MNVLCSPEHAQPWLDLICLLQSDLVCTPWPNAITTRPPITGDPGSRVQTRPWAQVGQPNRKWKLPPMKALEVKQRRGGISTTVTQLAYWKLVGVKTCPSPMNFTGYGTTSIFWVWSVLIPSVWTDLILVFYHASLCYLYLRSMLLTRSLFCSHLISILCPFPAIHIVLGASCWSSLSLDNIGLSAGCKAAVPRWTLKCQMHEKSSAWYSLETFKSALKITHINRCRPPAVVRKKSPTTFPLNTLHWSLHRTTTYNDFNQPVVRVVFFQDLPEAIMPDPIKRFQSWRLWNYERAPEPLS